MQLSNRLDNAQVNYFRIMNNMQYEARQAGKTVYDFSLGIPDFKPEQHVMEAVAKAAMDPGNYLYPMRLIPGISDAIINWFGSYNAKIEADEFVVVNGSQEGVPFMEIPMFNEGDLIIVPDPTYPTFAFGAAISGTRMYKVKLKAENDFLVDFNDIPEEIAREAKGMILCYPNNPTCGVATRKFFEDVVAFAKKYDILVIHDNPYIDLVFEGDGPVSFLSVEGAKDVGVEFLSFSKSYNLPAFRYSVCAGNKEVVAKLAKFNNEFTFCHFPAVQYGALAALTGPQDILARNREIYRKRAQRLVDGLNRIGWPCPPAKGTMFVWVPIPPHYTSCFQFAKDLMDRAGVCVLPGVNFGEGGEGFVRLALVVDEENIDKAMDAIDACGILKG